MMWKIISEVFLYSILMFIFSVIIVFKSSEMVINSYQNYLHNQTTIIRIEGGGKIYKLNTLTISEYYLDKLPLINYPEYVEVEE